MNKKILILGAGNAQIDAIKYCKDKGYEVAGCSYTTGDSGIPFLDYFEQIDIRDVEGVASFAKRIGAAAIYSVGSDLAMPTVMKASELIGLPHFISSETAEICHSKNRMREKLGIGFVGNTPFRVCSSLEGALKYTDFPGMMKPVDSQGQRGCYKVESAEDIEKYWEDSLAYSHEGKVIIEKYIDGAEVSVNAYFQDGELRFALLSDRYAFDEYPGGIIKEHRIPSSMASSDTQDKAVDLTRRIAEKLEINNGPAYFQIKLRNDRDPVIIEVTPRLDGCHMWNLIKHYCGADLLDACFRHLLEGEQVLTENYEFSDIEYSLKFMSAKTGTHFNSSDYDTDNAEYICEYYQNGDSVHKVNGYIEKCGYIIRRTGRRIR